MAASSQAMQQVEELFQRADVFLFKEKNYERAKALYRQILDREPENIDAINSIATCLRHSPTASGEESLVFNKICSLY